MSQICRDRPEGRFFLACHRLLGYQRRTSSHREGENRWQFFIWRHDISSFSERQGRFVRANGRWFFCRFYACLQAGDVSLFQAALNFLYSGQARCTAYARLSGRVRSKKTYASDRGTLRGIRPSRRRRSLLRPRDAARGVLRITATYLTARDTGKTPVARQPKRNRHLLRYSWASS